MAEDVRGRLDELDELLKAGIRDRPVVTFASLRRRDAYPAFDAGRLGYRHIQIDAAVTVFGDLTCRAPGFGAVGHA
jgi:hypothetical protein